MQETTTRPRLGTLTEAISYLGINERTLRRWLTHRETNGLKPIARKLGGVWRFDMKALEKWEPPQ